VNVNIPASVSSASYDAANELTNWAGGSFSYDANGDLTGDGANKYIWDVRNDLSSMTHQQRLAAGQFRL